MLPVVPTPTDSALTLEAQYFRVRQYSYRMASSLELASKSDSKELNRESIFIFAFPFLECIGLAGSGTGGNLAGL